MNVDHSLIAFAPIGGGAVQPADEYIIPHRHMILLE
jgi:hypothetical protein